MRPIYLFFQNYLICSYLIFLCLFVGNAFATDSQYDTQKTKKSEKDVSQTQKRSVEKKENKGKRKSETIQTGNSKQTQDIIRSVKQMMSSENADILLSAQTLFFYFIADKETQGIMPFSDCKVITNPKTPKSFGITAQINEYSIDTIKARFLNEAAHAGMPIRAVADEEEIIKYRNCIAFYGAIIAQSIINLKNNLNKNQHGNNLIISNMPYNDFLIIAQESFEDAFHDITDKHIISLYENIITNTDTCFFERNLENIKCSHTIFNLSTTPKLTSHNIEIFGDKFFNYQATFKLSTSWSFNDALEKMKSTSNFSRFVSDVIAYTEELESKGKTKEATLIKKKAIDTILQGKHTINLSQIKN